MCIVSHLPLDVEAQRVPRWSAGGDSPGQDVPVVHRVEAHVGGRSERPRPWKTQWVQCVGVKLSRLRFTVIMIITHVYLILKATQLNSLKEEHGRVDDSKREFGRVLMVLKRPSISSAHAGTRPRTELCRRKRCAVGCWVYLERRQPGSAGSRLPAARGSSCWCCRTDAVGNGSTFNVRPLPVFPVPPPSPPPHPLSPRPARSR